MSSQKESGGTAHNIQAHQARDAVRYAGVPRSVFRCYVSSSVCSCRFFDGAPLIRVPGRMHPVEVRYVPTAADNDIQEVRFFVEWSKRRPAGYVVIGVPCVVSPSALSGTQLLPPIHARNFFGRVFMERSAFLRHSIKIKKKNYKKEPAKNCESWLVAPTSKKMILFLSTFCHTVRCPPNFDNSPRHL